MPEFFPKRIRTYVFWIVLPFLSGCYYWQAARGQWEVLMKRQPVERLMNDPSTPSTLKQQLRFSKEIRDFAVQVLHLPENDSYRYYSNLQRDFVVWNVVAAPEFSLNAHQWCYWIVGCVGYRGYYSLSTAQEEAQRMREKHFDVQVYGVSAYSTLGWFDDPLLNTFIHREEEKLAGLIFHELAHQQYYRKDDSTFSESYATAVEKAGVLQWKKMHDQQSVSRETAEALNARFRQRENALLLQWREELQNLYAMSIPVAKKREQKRKAFKAFRAQYRQVMATFFKGGRFSVHTEEWLEKLNNATLSNVATYRSWAPAFLYLLNQDCNSHFKCFHQRVRDIGEMDKQKRDNALEALLLKAETQHKVQIRP